MYRTSHQSLSNPLARPSIQPKHSAVSTASAADTDWIPDAFLASLRWKPGAVKCSRSRNSSRAWAVGNAYVGKSVGGGFDDMDGVEVEKSECLDMK